MKAQRIRYVDHKFKPGHKISLNSYTSETRGSSYRIILNLEDMEYYIRNERTKEYIKKSTIKYTNINVLKRNARRALESFGVSLDTESRSRTFGRCETGYTMKIHLEKIRDEKKEEKDI